MKTKVGIVAVENRERGYRRLGGSKVRYFWVDSEGTLKDIDNDEIWAFKIFEEKRITIGTILGLVNLNELSKIPPEQIDIRDNSDYVLRIEIAWHGPYQAYLRGEVVSLVETKD